MWGTAIIYLVIGFSAAEHYMIRRSTYPPAGGGRWGRAVYPLGSHPQSRTFLTVSRPRMPTYAPESALWYPISPAAHAAQWSPMVADRFQFYHPALQMYHVTPRPTPPPMFSSMPQWYQPAVVPIQQQYPLTSMWYPTVQQEYPMTHWFSPDPEGYSARSPPHLYGDGDKQTSGDFEFQLYDYPKPEESSRVPLIYAMPGILGAGDSLYGVQGPDEVNQIGQPLVSRTGRRLMTLKPKNYPTNKIFEKLTRGYTSVPLEDIPESSEMPVDNRDIDSDPQKVDDLTLEDILRREQELPTSDPSDLQPANANPSPPLKRRRPPLVFPEHGYFSVPSESLEPPRQGSLIPFLSGIPFSKPFEGDQTTIPSTFLEPPKDDGPLLFRLPIPTDVSSENRSVLSELELPQEEAPVTFKTTSESEEHLAKTDEVKIPCKFPELPKEEPAPVFNDKMLSTSRLEATENTRTADLLLALARGLESKQFS